SSGTGVFATTASTSTTPAGALSVTVKGVQAGTNGIFVNAAGATPITVTSSAPVTAAAGAGIIAVGVDGPITITESGVTGTTGGVVAATTGPAGTGSITVNANGGTTTAT